MYSTKKPEPAKKLTLNDFPILNSSQFFFVEKTPMKSELLQYIHEAGINEEGIKVTISDRYEWMPKSCKLAKNILYDKSKQIIYRDDLLDKYSYEVIENAKRYFQNWIKMVGLSARDHTVCMGWFIDQLVDIDKTAELNEWDVYEPNSRNSK